MISGFSAADAERIVAARREGGPFTTVDEFARRTGLSAVVSRLARADVFASLGVDRRTALWESLPIQSTPPLLDELPYDEPTADLPKASEFDEVAADYKATSLSLRAHPFSFVREKLRRMGVLRAVDPSWSKEPKTKFPLINARAETVATQPSFRAPFERQRCLVPATGFYEWTGPKGKKQPHHIGLEDDEPFAFAGLWDRWNDELESCTVLTCEANALMADLHDRMPVILPREIWTTWLDPDSEREHLESLLEPFDPGAMQEYACNPIVNNVRNQTPDGIDSADS